MLLDARNVVRDSVIPCDLCIVGAGAAGITLAREFASTGASVLVLEAGGTERRSEDQTLYSGTQTGTLFDERIPYLSQSRLRYLGGTTNHWAGWCRPLDALDFERRAWIPNSGWPFSRSALEPYYHRACSSVQIRPFDYRSDDAVPPARRLLPDSDDVVTKLYHISPPTRFGEVYGPELVRSPNLTLMLHANAMGLGVDRDASRVEAVRVASLEGNRFEVLPRLVVLATGGIENARILLLSNDVVPRGLGNRHDRVGRYFADHPHLDAGVAILTSGERRLAIYAQVLVERIGQQVTAMLSTAPDTQRREQLRNFNLHLRHTQADRAGELAHAVEGHLAQLSALRHRSVPSEPVRDVGRAEPRYFTLDVSCEPTPNPESRVTLSDERDPLGQRRVHLDWKVEEADARSLRRSLELVAREFGHWTAGRARLFPTEQDPWPHAYGGSHHMGTTRMHEDPRQGVVDVNARVHGIENLYVAGSSVFPAFGVANPTLTLLALAIRLSDHLKTQLEGTTISAR
ncbi:GMC family oxidoreductase [Myxococcota bacterium]|nr:GMC family oxidoreductase [Myxococcota bacterium]